MADNTVDTLQIKISSDANRAVQAISNLQNKLTGLNTALGGLNTGGLSGLASGVSQLTHAMSAFKSGAIKTADFTRISNGLNKLGTVNVQGVSDASRAISTLTANLSQIGMIKFDSAGLDNITASISKLGRASVTEATQNLEFLKSSVSQFVAGMNSIGSVTFGTENLYKLVSSVSRLGSKNATQSVKNLPQISVYLKEFINSMNAIGNVSFDFAGLNNLVANISRLGGSKATQSVKNLKPIKDQLLRFISGLNGIGALNFDLSGLNGLVSAISRLGGKAATNAVPNIQALGIALKQLMATLSTAPLVSQNLINMTNALANLAANGARAGTASRNLQNSFTGYNASVKSATKGTKGFVSQLGMLYARYFLLIRIGKWFGKSIKSAMDYVETLNYFNAAFGQVADKADTSAWKEYGYESAESYANSFADRSKQLTKKLTGFNVDNSGELTRTNMPSLGLDPNKVMQYQATFAQMASSMGVASETSLKLSNALTMIGTDLASVRNMKFESVWEDMASGMVGMSRTLDKYGVNIRNANLQQELYNLGIDKSIAKLDQQDKAILRTVVLLNGTRYAWGDLANTINQPANQLRLLQSNFASLARTIGSLFIPVITKLLPYISALVIALQRLFAWIGGLLGIKLSGFTPSVGGAAVDMGDFADGADDSAGALDDAAKNANKLNKATRDWDELHIASANDGGSGGGGGAGGGGGGIGELDAALDAALAAYQKAWDDAYANMENRANEMADKVVSAFKRIWDTAEPTREALSRLWNEGFSQLSNFTWTALKDFWNDFLVPLGNWSLGTGFPMLIDAVNNFLKTINWTAINDALRKFWQALEPFAENVGEGLIRFFDDLLKVGAKFINGTLPNGLNSLADALKKIDPKTAENIGYGLGILATALIGFKGINKISSIIGVLSTNFGKFFKVAGIAKYGAIAVGIGAVVVALDKFGYINVDWKTLSDAFGKLASALGKFAVGIGKGLILFFEGLLKMVSPVLEGLINGAAKALDGLANILNAIPESVISGITTVLISFFLAFQAYKAVIMVGGLISMLTSNLRLFASVLPGIVNSGPILKNLATALGPAALGGIQFTLIAGGIIALASAFKKFYDDATDNPELEAWAEEFSESLDKINSKSKNISEELDQLKSDYEDSGEAQSKVAEELAKKYQTLHEKAEPTASDIALMRQYSEDLVKYYPELESFFNKETGLLETNASDIQKVIDKQKEMAKVKASLSGLEESYKQQIEAQKNLDEVNKKEQESYKKAQEARAEWSAYLESHPTYANTGSQGLFEGDPFGLEAKKIQNASSLMTQAHIDAQNAVGDAQEVLSKSQQSIDDYAKLYDESAKKVYNATPDFIKSFEDVGVSVEENLSRKLQDSGSDSVEAVLSMFSQMKSGTIQSGEQLKTVFDGIGTSLPTAFMDALKNQTDATVQSKMAEIFLNLGSGVQQSAESLKTIFNSVGLQLPDSIINGLSEKSGELQNSTVSLLGNIESGKSLRENELKSLFLGLGLDLSDELSTALANSEAGVQEDTIELLSCIEAGEGIKKQDLIDLFSKLGLDLPTELRDKLLSQSSEVQKSTIELLTRVQSGQQIKKPELIKLFSGLGITLPDELISSLESKNGDTQAQAVELLGQISNAADTEREPLINKLKDLGVEGTDNLNQGLGSKNEELKTTTEGMVNTVKDTANNALDPNDQSNTSMYNAGANASKGFWQGLKDWWDDSWLAQQIDKMKKVVTGKSGLDEHSPSRVFRQYGAYAIEGFNLGISDEMQNTFSELGNWTTRIKKIDVPSFSTGYEINRSVLDTVDVSYNMGNINAKSINAQAGFSANSIAELVSETRRRNDLAEEQNELLRGIYDKPVIDKNDVGTLYKSYAKDFRSQTGKQLGISF